MKKILIIGGCGYIGSALFDHLSKSHEVTTLDLEWFGNFNNPQNIRVDFSKADGLFLSAYDVIILVAANSSVQLCRDIHDSFDNNVAKFSHLIRRLGKQKFIYASSSCVYVTSDDKPKVESDPLYPLDGLTMTKTMIDQMMPLTDVEYYGLRFGSVAGWSPNMRLDLMVNAMTLSARDNSRVNVFNGDAHRPLLSINDLCRAVYKIVDSAEDKRGVYNLASVNYSIRDIGKRIADKMGVPMIDNGNNFTYDFTISSDKFKQTFDFEFDDDIEDMVETILVNPTDHRWKKRETK